MQSENVKKSVLELLGIEEIEESEEDKELRKKRKKTQRDFIREKCLEVDERLKKEVEVEDVECWNGDLMNVWEDVIVRNCSECRKLYWRKIKKFSRKRRVSNIFQYSEVIECDLNCGECWYERKMENNLCVMICSKEGCEIMQKCSMESEKRLVESLSLYEVERCKKREIDLDWVSRGKKRLERFVERMVSEGRLVWVERRRSKKERGNGKRVVRELRVGELRSEKELEKIAKEEVRKEEVRLGIAKWRDEKMASKYKKDVELRERVRESFEIENRKKYEEMCKRIRKERFEDIFEGIY